MSISDRFLEDAIETHFEGLEGIIMTENTVHETALNVSKTNKYIKMETKKSVVKSVQPNGTWDGKFGLMYKFEITMDNGDTGQYMSKSKDQTKFVVGQEVDYEYHSGEYPKIKPVNTFQQGGNFSKGKSDDVQEMIVKQSSLKAAVDYCKGDTCSTRDIIDYAEEFYLWVTKGIKPDENNKKPF